MPVRQVVYIIQLTHEFQTIKNEKKGTIQSILIWNDIFNLFSNQNSANQHEILNNVNSNKEIDRKRTHILFSYSYLYIFFLLLAIRCFFFLLNSISHAQRVFHLGFCLWWLLFRFCTVSPEHMIRCDSANFSSIFFVFSRIHANKWMLNIWFLFSFVFYASMHRAPCTQNNCNRDSFYFSQSVSEYFFIIWLSCFLCFALCYAIQPIKWFFIKSPSVRSIGSITSIIFIHIRTQKPSPIKCHLVSTFITLNCTYVRMCIVQAILCQIPRFSGRSTHANCLLFTHKSNEIFLLNLSTPSRCSGNQKKTIENVRVHSTHKKTNSILSKGEKKCVFQPMRSHPKLEMQKNSILRLV